jgi:hypothetical protein
MQEGSNRRLQNITLPSSSNNTAVIKSNWVRLAGHAAYMGEIRISEKSLIG